MIKILATTFILPLMLSSNVIVVEPEVEFKTATTTEYTSISASEVEVEPDIPPILKKIAICESMGDQQHWQYDVPKWNVKEGDLVRGIWSPADIGRFQINTNVWQDTADKLGYDLKTKYGNTKMALYLYEKHGTTPWKYSKDCWNG